MPFDATHSPGDPAMSSDAHAALQAAAKDHLWMHFTRMSSYAQADVPVIVRGEGPYVWDAQGRRYLDALAGLFVNQLGHGRTDLAEAAAQWELSEVFWIAKHGVRMTGMPAFGPTHDDRTVELVAKVAPGCATATGARTPAP